MARFPHNNSNNSSSFSYTGAAEKQQQLHHPPRRHFVLNLAAVPPDIATVIQTNYQILEKQQRRRRGSSTQILCNKLADQQERVRTLTEKVQALEQAKEESLRDIRQVRDEETKVALEALEAAMRKKHSEKIQEEEQEWKKDLELQCQEKLKRQRDARVASEAAAADAAAAAAKRHKSSEPEKESLADLKQKEIDDLKSTLDSLQEKRSEMVWLLKQAIKAEEKQKKGLDQDKNPQSKIMTSKLA